MIRHRRRAPVSVALFLDDPSADSAVAPEVLIRDDGPLEDEVLERIQSAVGPEIDRIRDEAGDPVREESI